MNRKIRERFISTLRPLFLAISFVVSEVSKPVFWLPALWLQYRADQALWAEVQSTLYFLTSRGQRIKKRKERILPFDYAMVTLVYENICFYFTKGRGELNVSVAPSRNRDETSHLNFVLAILEGKQISKFPEPQTMPEVRELLLPRIQALNEAFSESAYPKFLNRR